MALTRLFVHDTFVDAVDGFTYTPGMRLTLDPSTQSAKITRLQNSGVISTDETLDPSAPGPIGDGTPNTGAFTQLDVDNLRADGNTISSTNTNGNISLTPNGTGSVVIPKVDINGGAIDGAPIGAASASTGVFTDLTSTSGMTFNGQPAVANIDAPTAYGGFSRRTSTEGTPPTGQNGFAGLLTYGFEATTFFQMYSGVVNDRVSWRRYRTDAFSDWHDMVMQNLSSGLIDLHAPANAVFQTDNTRDIIFSPAGTERVRMLASGNVGIRETSPDYALDVNGTFGFSPGSSVTPVDNGDIVFEATNNTTFTVKLKGSDGTVRSGTLTLA